MIQDLVSLPNKETLVISVLEQSKLWIIRTFVFFLVEEGLAQDMPCGLVKLLQVQLPAIRFQVFQDLLHCAEFCNSFAQSLRAVQTRGHDDGRRDRLLRKIRK